MTIREVHRPIEYIVGYEADGEAIYEEADVYFHCEYSAGGHGDRWTPAEPSHTTCQRIEVMGIDGLVDLDEGTFPWSLHVACWDAIDDVEVEACCEIEDADEARYEDEYDRAERAYFSRYNL